MAPSKPRAGLLLASIACASLWLACASTQHEVKDQKREEASLKTAATDTAQAAFEETVVDTYPAVVVNRKINLRSGPGTTYSIVEALSGGQVVTVVATSGEWVKVLVDRDNRMGWIHKSLIRRKR